jgi:peroxiredoxin Q/BCP
MLKIGDMAPDFSLMSDTQEQITLSKLKGKKVVLYFYPKDSTPGCTKEACDFRDSSETFAAHNTVVLGVSRDSLKSHTKFRTNHSLPFPLLSDEKGEVCEKYGVWVEKSMFGVKYFGIKRSTFLIDETGKIVKIWDKVKVLGHVNDVLKQLKGS